MRRLCFALAGSVVAAPATLLLLGLDALPLRAQAQTCERAVIDTIAGGGVGDGLPAAEAVLYAPASVAVAPDGSLYIADRRGARIRKVDPAGRIATVAGNGSSSHWGDGGLAVRAGVSSPRGIALGPDGSLYVADGDRVRKISPDGIITTVAGTGQGGSSGDGGPATEAMLHYPADVALGPHGDLYIADYRNHRIRRVGRDGIITTIAGVGESGFSGEGGPATEAQLSYPEGVGIGPDGSVYVADYRNNRVRKIHARNGRVDSQSIITTVAGNGRRGRSGDGGPATEAVMTGPHDVAVGSDGSLYITAGGTVRRVDPAGMIGTLASPGSASGLSLDARGRLYVAGPEDHRVWLVGPDGVMTTAAGGGTDDGGLAERAALYDPWSVALAADGSVYIADWGNFRVRRVTPDGLITTVQGDLGLPAAVAVDADGSLYVADIRRDVVRKVDASGAVAIVAGSLNRRGYSGDGGPATEAQLDRPIGLAVGTDGSLYIADEFNHRVRKVDVDGIISTVAGTGERAHSGDGGPAIEAALDRPRGVAVGADGSLYVADSGNHRIRNVDDRGIITTAAGNGSPGYSGDGGAATEASLSWPAAVALLPDGSLCIADRGNYRIRKVDTAGRITTLAGTGIPGSWGDGNPADEASMSMLAGLAAAADGSLYIACHQRVRKVWSRPCDPEVARTRAESLRARAGDSLGAWREVFELYLIAEDWQEALAAVDQMLSLVSETDERERIRCEVLVARVYAAQRDDHEARRRLIRALARADDALVLREAGGALVDLSLLRGEREQAIATLNDLRLRTQDRDLHAWIDHRLKGIVGD